MGPDTAPRAVRRREVGWPLRVQLAEDDLDEMETAVAEFASKLDKIEDRQNQILVSLVVGALLLALNIGVMLSIGGAA